MDGQSTNESGTEWHDGCQRPSLAPPLVLNTLNKEPIECSSVRAELRPRVPPVLVLSSPAERSGWPAVSTRKPWESFLAER